MYPESAATLLIRPLKAQAARFRRGSRTRFGNESMQYVMARKRKIPVLAVLTQFWG